MKSKRESEPLLVSRSVAAELLGVSTRFLYNLRKRGELRARRLGRRVLFNRLELERYASTQEASP